VGSGFHCLRSFIFFWKHVGMLFFITEMITAGYHGNHKKSITSDYNTDRASNQ